MYRPDPTLKPKGDLACDASGRDRFHLPWSERSLV